MEILLRHWRFVLFGFLTAFATHLGQTFFFSLFNSGIRADFDLSNERFGLMYMLATLTSGLLIARAGALVDRVDLRLWACGLAVAMLVAALLFGSTHSVIVLTFAIFALRFTGQGLLNHTVSTTMARYFDKARGRALALAGFGFPTAEALLPAVAAFLLIGWGLDWRVAWIAMSCATIALYLPAVLLLLGKAQVFGEVADQLAAEQKVGTQLDDTAVELEGVTRAQMLRGKTFWLLMPIIFTPSFISTGWIFHHQPIADMRGWPLEVFALAFGAAALTSAVSNLAWGTLVDRFSAKTLIWMPMAVLALAQLFFFVQGPAWLVVVAFMFLGLMQGGMSTAGSAVWAELFGRKHLGAIKAIGTSVMIFGSAGAPFVMGKMLDADLGVGALALLSASLALFAMGCGLIITQRLAPLVRHGQM